MTVLLEFGRLSHEPSGEEFLVVVVERYPPQGEFFNSKEVGKYGSLRAALLAHRGQIRFCMYLYTYATTRIRTRQ